MLRLSKKVEYGVIIIARLSYEKADLLSAAEIAKSYDISRPLVANVLKIFNRHKIVSSVRGVQGGYRLMEKPENISLARLIRILDGEFALTKCRHVKPNSGEDAPPCVCTAIETCPMRKPIEKVQFKIADFFESIKCDQLIDRDVNFNETGDISTQPQKNCPTECPEDCPDRNEKCKATVASQ